MSERQKGVSSMSEYCETYFPKAHAAKTCGCYPKPPQRVIVILPRPGV